MKGLYVLNADAFGKVYGRAEQEEIGELLDVYAPPQTAQSIRADPSLLGEAEVILSGWGAPVMDAGFLEAAGRLRAVFYGAGSVRGFVTPEFWRREIVLTTAASANAVPVSEYTLAVILLSLKRFWVQAGAVRETKTFPALVPVAGAYGSTVGLVSLGLVGSLVRERLRPFDLEVAVYDPFVTPAEAARLGVELLTLPELFRSCDVVSLHSPWLPETEGMIAGALVGSMKQGATLINTARGALMREEELVAVLAKRPDLSAVLDVTHPEPPSPDSPLYRLPNVVLTPHIAGSLDRECRRMGRTMVEELRRYIRGRPLRWAIDEKRALTMA